MMKFLDELLAEFRSCFSRKATYQWFIVIVAGLLVRTDHLGVTSVIRGLFLSVDYVTLLGMIILKAESYEEAKELCEREPLVVDGYATYKLMSLQVGTRENNYLL